MNKMEHESLSKAWHMGYESYGPGDSNPYEPSTKNYDDFEWGYSCAISDEESYEAWQKEQEEEQ